MIRLILLLLTFAASAVLADAAESPRPLNILFLGDEGHHNPHDRAAQIIPILAGRGIHVTYTNNIQDLNPANLARYDALAVYANIDEIAPREAKALLDYVAAGGGFVPIHCASYCFRNNPDVVALMGGQFLRHGMGDFDTNNVASDHPILRGLAPFRTWDETYVHHLHNEKDRTVLQTRTEGNAEEPWTWVRTHGKGRVFYTAYGHDQRTWSEPGFQNLIERGIRWAANKGEVFDSGPHVREELPPFEYVEAEVPNYLPGEKWGTMGEPIRKMQQPLSPAESQKHLVVPPGFEAQLFVSEPEIGKPLAMAWDHRGRLWICETVDYPNDLQPSGEGHDRIKICEDTNGDGKADRFTIFADKLSIPTSLTIAGGGVIVHQAPDTLFLQDTNGDDKADVRRVLFTGWGTGDTHAGPSNLRYGLDNWIYSMVGYAGFSGTVGGEEHKFSAGLLRFKPDGSKLEFLRSTNNNSWGVGLSEEGLLFGSTANGCPSVYMPIANRYYERVRGWSSSVLNNIAINNRFFPITEKVRQVDWFGGFTAGAGHALYTARNYPQQYWNRTAFVNEPTGHLTATFNLVPNGSDFVAYNSWNLLASDDEWTAPIAAEVGPDGNVWVIDWYNFIVQHNPTPHGFKTGKRGAYETPLRDKTHGRIYRVVHTAASAPLREAQGWPSLGLGDAGSSLAALKNDNMLWRLQAQRLLIERGKPDLAPQLLELIRDKSADALGLNPPAIHALWTLHGLSLLDGSHPEITAAAVEALKHPAAGVRRNALLVLPAKSESFAAIDAAGSLADPDAQVRLAAFLAIADLPPTPDSGERLLAAIFNPANLQDRWIPDAAASAAAVNDVSFLKAAIASKDNSPLDPKLTALTSRIAEHFARGTAKEQVEPILLGLATASPQIADALIDGMAKGWPKGQQVQLSDNAERALVELLTKAGGPAKTQIANLAARWGSKGLEKYSAEISASLLKRAQDTNVPETERIAAAAQLIDLRKQDLAAVKSLLELLGPRTLPELAGGLIQAASKSESPDVGAALIESLNSVTPAVRPNVMTALLGRADWVAAFLAAVESGKIQLAELSLDQKQALAAHPNKEIAERAKSLLASGGSLPDANRQKVIDELGPLVLKGGDAAKGKLVFKAQCAKCHMHSGEGNKIGPDLTGMAAHPKQELLIHILDPSRSVEGNFRVYSVVTDEGRVFNGLLASESKTAIELLDADAKRQTILRENIEQLVASNKSLMPEGFEKQVPPEAIADLLAFLTQRGKYLPLDLRKVATTVSTRGMFISKDSDVERLIFPDWSPKTFAGVPFQLVDPQGDRVANAVLLYGPTGALTQTLPKSVSLPCNAPAKAIHLLSGVSGWGFPIGEKGSVSMIVRLHYADGQTEDHELKNGIHFADYIRVVDVPESKLAFQLRGQQIRYLAVYPKRGEPIESIELMKGPDATAPVVMAATVEARD